LLCSNCQAAKEEVKPAANKYSVRQPKDLRSRFDQKQEAKRLKQIADEDERLRKLEEERLLVGYFKGMKIKSCVFTAIPSGITRMLYKLERDRNFRPVSLNKFLFATLQFWHYSDK
jgi:hypothetical protein